MGHLFSEDESGRRRKRRSKESSFDESVRRFGEFLERQREAPASEPEPRRVRKRLADVLKARDNPRPKNWRRRRKKLFPRLVWTNPTLPSKPARYVRVSELLLR